MRNVLFLFVTYILTHFVDSHFLGGSISWTSDTGANNVSKLTYFYPFMPNGIARSYQLYQSISVLMVVGWCFEFVLKF